MIIIPIIFLTIKAQDYICSCCHFFSKWQAKIIKTSWQKIWKIVYRNEYKTKSENQKATSKYRYFLESNFVGVNRLFVLVYTNQDANAKKYNAQKY